MSVARQYDLVAPEGGWGYVVCLGLSLAFIAATAHLPSLGFIYREFLEERGEGTSALASVQGVFSLMTAVAGFVANMALKRYTLRTVGIWGAITFTFGAFINIFVQTTFQLFITAGVIQGFGLGIMMPVLYTTYNNYFTLKRILYLSLCKAGIGLFIMIYPLIVKVSMEEFGFRGTLMILCALSANAIPATLVMHPVSWHLKKVPKGGDHVFVIPPTPAVDGENKNGFTFKQNGDANNITNTEELSKSAENLQPLLEPEKDLENVPVKAQTLLVVSPESERRSSTPVISLGDRRLSSMKPLDDRFSSNDEVYVNNVMKAVSVASLANIGADPLPLMENKQGKWQTVVQYLDLSLLKDPIYTNIVVGLSFSFFADLMFFALEPLLLAHYGFDQGQVANIISLGGATDMVGKLALSLIGQFFGKISSRQLYFVGSLLPAICRTIFLQFSSYAPVLALTGVLGLLRALVHINLPLAMAEHVPVERFPAAWSLYMVMFGFINITVGPLIGIVRDWTGSYPLAFHLLSACNLVCVIPWTVEYVAVAIGRKTSKSQS